MAPDRRRPVRATPAPRRTLSRTVAIGVMVIAGAVTGIALGGAGDSIPGASWVRERMPAPAPVATAPAAVATAPAAVATASALVAPITAPTREPIAAEPAISVEPGLDKGRHSLDDPASPWVVVNKQRAVNPEQWEPPDLDSAGGAPMVPTASQALVRMRDAAADAGVPLSVGTGYRAYGFQQYLFNDYVASWGRERADRFSARAGHSEHQTGWAVDVYASAACRLKECFADEPAGEWVAAHGHEYGFITRYPQGAEDVTGYKHEPWHLRYVGVDLATAMHELEIATMEEFFSLPAAPGYD